MSDVRDPERDQVAPTPNDGPSCHDLVCRDVEKTIVQFRKYHDLVVEDLKERKEHGLRKYNSLLQPYNGRSMLLDAYEESLDLAVYLRGAREEEKDARPEGALTILQSYYEQHLKLVVHLRRALEIERLGEKGA